MIEAKGLSVPVKDGDPLTGFITERRVFASDDEEAKSRAVDALRKEPKVQRLLEFTASSLGSADAFELRATQVGTISWLSWHFAGFMKGFAFSTDEVRGDDHYGT